MKKNEFSHLKYIFPLLLISLLILSVTLSGCASSRTTVSPIFKNISVPEAAELIKNYKNKPDFTILDVRTQEEFTAGHIEGALNLDFYSATFKDDLNKLDKGNTYFVYCRSGNRSGQAMKIMESLGFQEVYNLSAGINDWVDSGQPLVQ